MTKVSPARYWTRLVGVALVGVASIKFCGTLEGQVYFMLGNLGAALLAMDLRGPAPTIVVGGVPAAPDADAGLRAVEAALDTRRADLMSALKNLGYTRGVAKLADKTIARCGPNAGLEELIRDALAKE